MCTVTINLFHYVVILQFVLWLPELVLFLSVSSSGTPVDAVGRIWGHVAASRPSSQIRRRSKDKRVLEIKISKSHLRRRPLEIVLS